MAAPVEASGSTLRIALYGGSFDPPHRGHVAIARAAADHFLLDQVLFAPTARQPLKPAGAVAPYTERLAMTALACESDLRFIASSLDGPHPGGAPNYTAETLQRLRLLHPGARLFNLAGIDSFLTLAAWHAAGQLLGLAEWIVVSRPGFPLGNTVPDPHGMVLSPAQRARIHVLDTVHEDVSGTSLRQRLRAGEPCSDLLPAAVANYIARHRLYAGVA